MKLRVIDLDIATGGVLVAIMNQKDASLLDLHPFNRIKIIKGTKIGTVLLNISETKKIVPKGYIGLFEEVLKSLGLKHNDIVNVDFAKKPLSLDFIKKKLDGHSLNKKEINQIVWDIVHNKLNSIELTYFVSACYARNLNSKETVELTKAMARHGDILKINRYPIIDKHCVGGIPGNRTTMILVPILAAAGYCVPKTSSRSITSPAGTADTMEVLTKVELSLTEIKKIILKINGCMVWGGALNLAPADDKIIQVEKPLNIDAESQLLASIMAKKQSVSSTHILIDIPVGRGAKVTTINDARRIRKDFLNIGKKLKKKMRVMITKGSEPIGNGIGPALEARDVMWVLERDERRPLDLERKCIKMATVIFSMVGIRNGKKMSKEILSSGLAYKKMVEIIKAQGGHRYNPTNIKLGNFKYIVRASKNGRVVRLRNKVVSKVARVAGAPQDKEAGIYLHKHVGSKVKNKEPLMTIYARNNDKLKYAKSVLKEKQAFKIK